MPRSPLAVPLVFGLLLGGALGGCLGEAPHENPLDPLAEGFRAEGAIEGRVTGVFPVDGALEGRADVPVRFVPVGPAGRPELATRTDAGGYFGLSELPTGPWAVVAEDEGLSRDADTVVVEAGRVAETLLQLEAVPVVEEQDLRTVHIVRWFPTDPVFQLEVEVTARDPDGRDDVASATLVVPDPAPAALPLAPVPGEPGRFARVFDEAELPAGVEGLLGRALRAEVRDASGNVAGGPPVSLVRVIEQSPQTQSPQAGDVTGPLPTLVWRPAQVPFAFTYRVDVFLLDGAGVPNLVDQATGLGPAVTSYAVGAPLAPGDYFWTVWIVDAFGNRSRSREAGFRVL
jgi:hypothetical protein